jgi:hypothetical protein
MEKRAYYSIIGAVIFAGLVWFSVNMRDEYTVVRLMPVVLENLKDGKALKYPIPRTVSVRFHGNGWSLAGLFLSPDVKYYIDLSSVGTDDFIITARDLLEHIKLPVALQPLDVKPDSIVLALDDYREVRVAVVPRVVLNFHDGYGQVGPLRIAPESIVIGGSRRLVQQTGDWPTLYRKYDDLRSPIDENLPLEQQPYYSLDVPSNPIRVQVNVQPFAEKTMAGIPLTATGTPANREVIFIPPKIDIIVRGGIDRLAKLTQDDFQANVAYRTLIQDSVETIVPELVTPSELKVIVRTPEQFQFIIRKKL